MVSCGVGDEMRERITSYKVRCLWLQYDTMFFLDSIRYTVYIYIHKFIIVYNIIVFFSVNSGKHIICMYTFKLS